MRVTRWIRGSLVVGGLALAAAACGSATSESETDTGLAPVSDGLPLADQEAGEPSVQAACLPEEPLCEDSAADSGQEPPQTSDEATPRVPAVDTGPEEISGGETAGMPVEGGLTIAEALATEATGVIAVQGHLYVDQDGTQLCDELVGGGERYVCGGALLDLADFDPAILGPALVFHDGLTYTEETITLFGELDDGLFAVENLVAG